MNSTTCLIASVASQTFAIPLDWIQSITRTPTIVQLPGALDHIRGTVKTQEGWLPLIDLRIALGLKSAESERNNLIASLRERRKEHLGWLAKLAESAKKGEPFQGEIDPTRCAFGRWHSSYKPTSSSMLVLMRQFGEDHPKIHQVAVEVGVLQRAGRHADAVERIEKAKHQELARLLILFEQAISMLNETHREISISLLSNNNSLAIAFDEVHRVEEVELIDSHLEDQVVRYGEQKIAVLFQPEMLAKLQNAQPLGA